VDGEHELLEEFKKTIRLVKPDFLVGYGSDSFDWPFLLIRCRKYSTRLDISLDSSEIFLSKTQRSIKTKGIPNLDISKFIRNIFTSEFARFRLDTVAQKLMGRGKSAAPNLARINELWATGTDEQLGELARYNLTDAELTLGVFEKIQKTLFQLVKLTSLAPAEVNSSTYGMLVEAYLISNAKRFGQLIPNLPNRYEVFDRRRQTYAGGFVIEPVPGFYRNLAIFDFEGFYPSIIASHNISPDTISCRCCEHKGMLRTDEAVWFCSQEKGFISTIIQDLIERKGRVSEILEKTDANDPSYEELKARRYALKTIANATYGYMGYAGARWYSLECAQAVTLIAKQNIQQVVKEAERFGFRPVYSDTDSLFALTGEKKLPDIMKFVQTINATLPAPMELEYRDSYPAGIFIEKKTGLAGAKKRYALLTNQGELILRGLEAVRGDWSRLAREAQKKILRIILSEGSAEKANTYLQELINRVKARQVDVEDLAIKVRLTRNLNEYQARGPHVAAAELARDKGRQMGRGSMVSFIVKSGEGKISDRVILAEDAKPADYDIDYYIESQLVRATLKIFELFGYSEDKLKQGQTTLGVF
jgi:DNA polymerase elongation subunit (family B)